MRLRLRLRLWLRRRCGRWALDMCFAWCVPTPEWLCTWVVSHSDPHLGVLRSEADARGNVGTGGGHRIGAGASHHRRNEDLDRSSSAPARRRKIVWRQTTATTTAAASRYLAHSCNRLPPPPPPPHCRSLQQIHRRNHPACRYLESLEEILVGSGWC